MKPCTNRRGYRVTPYPIRYGAGSFLRCVPEDRLDLRLPALSRTGKINKITVEEFTFPERRNWRDNASKQCKTRERRIPRQTVDKIDRMRPFFTVATSYRCCCAVIVVDVPLSRTMGSIIIGATACGLEW